MKVRGKQAAETVFHLRSLEMCELFLIATVTRQSSVGVTRYSGNIFPPFPHIRHGTVQVQPARERRQF